LQGVCRVGWEILALYGTLATCRGPEKFDKTSRLGKSAKIVFLSTGSKLRCKIVHYFRRSTDFTRNIFNASRFHQRNRACQPQAGSGVEKRSGEPLSPKVVSHFNSVAAVAIDGVQIEKVVNLYFAVVVAVVRARAKHVEQVI
jgi:hypothetical protein